MANKLEPFRKDGALVLCVSSGLRHDFITFIEAILMLDGEVVLMRDSKFQEFTKALEATKQEPK